MKIMDEVPIRDSHLSFLSPPPQSFLNRSNNHSYNLTDDIFLNSLNKSYIGHISGRKKQIKQIDYEIFAPSRSEKELNNHKRINFSTFKGVTTSKIYNGIGEKITSTPPISNKFGMGDMRKTPKNIVTKQIPKEISNEIDQQQTLMILSFTGKEKKQMLYEQGCGICSNKMMITRCRLVQSNESTLQIYLQGVAKQNKQSKYDKLLFCVNFDTLEVNPHSSPKANTQLVITVGQNQLLFEHTNPAVIEYWYEQLNQMKSQCKGSQLHLTRLLGVEDFYTRRYQTEEFFTEHCQTGDIILFQDTHFFAKAQRFFTRSDFDHVAVVIKDQQYGILLLESMSSGVSLTPWRSIIRYGWYEDIPRIVWRRLTVERDDQFFQTVQKFVKDNLQKSYHISFAKITAYQSVIRQDSKEKEKQNIDNDDGFFCSELVATLYKDLGLLTRQPNHPNYQPACKFYPKDFSLKGERKLDFGELSPQYDIFFEKKLLKHNYRGFIKD